MVAENGHKSNGRRRSLLDLAPLERDCMLALWPLGQGTVRQIREGLAATRPRAYTTIMTIMDRLARKGVVTRNKVGRGYVYQPSFTEDELRAHAVAQVVDHFFAGSREALLAHLKGGLVAPRTVTPPAVSSPAPREMRRELSSEDEPRTPAAPALDPSLL